MSGELERTLVVEEGEKGRVDQFLAKTMENMTRSQIKARLQALYRNGKPARMSDHVRPGDTVHVLFSPEPETSVEPENLPLDILYEDDRVLVIEKAAGMVVHPARGNWQGTLVNAVLGHSERRHGGLDKDRFEKSERPGIVHRLDKDTSGVIIVAKSPEVQEFLAEQFRSRRAKKEYWAITRSRPAQGQGTIEGLLGRDPRHRQRFAVRTEQGKWASTKYEVVSETSEYALMRLHPITGRTHQLRVHMKHLGCPIVGDPLYGRRDTRFPDVRLMLHARLLEIRVDEDSSPQRFVAPFPTDMRSLARELGLDLPLES
jgi:23S rRNA pseudouridine1911/1915/1917 synthase